MKTKLFIAGLFFFSSALQAYAIEAYRAQEIQPSYRAAEVKPYQSGDIQPYQSSEIKPYVADEVKPQPSAAASTSEAPVNVVRVPKGSQPAPRTEQRKPAAPAKSGAKALVGLWQTSIPGAVYTTPSGVAGYDILHVSSGTVAGLLRINANGTYSWNSYGGKKGKWVTSTDPEYPLEIIDTVENRRWKVGYSASKGTLIIWSGSFWYEGRKAEVKKK